ncbi:MAG: hypothetical protein AAF635_11990 [Cyanobacteria bacterium P01_C01_bin.69]
MFDFGVLASDFVFSVFAEAIAPFTTELAIPSIALSNKGIVVPRNQAAG